MSELCEICEGLAVATSSCPAVDVIMVRGEAANASSSVVPATQPEGVLTGSSEATDTVVVDAYAVLLNSAHAASTVSHTMVVTELLQNSARGVSSLIQGLNQMAESVAQATDEILTADASHLLVSAAQALSSTAGSGTISNIFLEAEGQGASFASLGLSEAVVSSATATGLVAVLQRRVDVEAASAGGAASTVYPTVRPDTYLLLSTADGTSLIQVQTDATLFVTASAETSSDVWYQDPSAKAWVMNTETTAMGWYDNFSFESVVSWQGRELAVGPEGIYELTGDTDNGQFIDAFVESGFTDFGVAQTKRLDNMYFGYTSDGKVAVQTEVYESGSPPYTYLLEERDASAPRNTRMTPGKGLWGRYWRLTITNVGGSDFEVHDATVDIAVSTRRI